MNDRPDSAAEPGRRPLWAPSWEILPLGLLLVIWTVALTHYPRLPDYLPSSFRFGGEPLAWSPKGLSFFVLPALAAFSFLALSTVGRLAAKRPSLWGRPFHGLAARGVGRLLRRYLFLMKSALLVFLLNVEFRSVQVAYGGREGLGWDSYLTGGILLGYALIGSVTLYLGARRWLRWQERREAESPDRP